MAKKIVIKVTISCGKDKKDIMKAVAKLEGINEMKIDIEKGTLTIIGDVDPVCVIKALRKKCGICAEIDSVGPEKPPEPKKPESPKCKSPKCPSSCKCPKCVPCPPPCPPCCQCPKCVPCPRPCPPPCPRPCPPPCQPCPPRPCDYDRNSCPIL